MCSKEALSERDVKIVELCPVGVVAKKRSSETSITNYAGFRCRREPVRVPSEKQSRKESPEFGNVMRHLDAFITRRKLQLFCEMINLKSCLPATAELTLFNEVKAQPLILWRSLP